MAGALCPAFATTIGNHFAHHIAHCGFSRLQIIPGIGRFGVLGQVIF
ncbi:hypothetical protein ECTW15901_2474 [Escherichia coli TW15901]|nr:hypothetical protein ECTW15901_2474 [Escherichia coli TW15901]EKI27415.1 hypothetical protein ECTW00353_2359 [Escherichia coli TW00353]